MVFPHARHVFTVAAYCGLAGTGFEIVFSYANGRTVDVNHTQMVYGAGHFTKVTAAALFSMCSNLHYVTLAIYMD